jgi:protein-S-isoprenylcysteine O-methyltransferase
MLASFFSLERVLRRGSAATVRPTDSDRRSTVLLLGAYALVIVRLSLGGFSVGALPNATRASGLVLGSVGLVLRVWAMRSLGSAYTRTLTIVDGQRIVRSGPYAAIRHPGYLASLLVWSGAAVAVGSLPVALLVVAMLVAAYAYRISAEERMLATAFPEEYPAYQAMSKRLVPFVY